MNPYHVGQVVEVALPSGVEPFSGPFGTTPAVVEPTDIGTRPDAGTDQWLAGVIRGVALDGRYVVEVTVPPVPSYRLVRVTADRVRLPSSP